MGKTEFYDFGSHQEYKNVLISLDADNFLFNNPLPLIIYIHKNVIIGSAILWKDGEKLYAEIRIDDDSDYSKYYPYIEWQPSLEPNTPHIIKHSGLSVNKNKFQDIATLKGQLENSRH